jgi:hypothetical protein
MITFQLVSPGYFMVAELGSSDKAADTVWVIIFRLQATEYYGTGGSRKRSSKRIRCRKKAMRD